MKRRFSVIAIVLVLCMLVSACSKPTSENETSDKKVSETEVASDGESKDETQEPVEKKNVKFYGKIVEYTSGEGTCEKLQEKLVDSYTIESLQVDWGNIEQVIRTGIAANEPCDIYNYWPIYLKPFVEEGMATDLTPYLDENDGEWRKTFNPTLLAMGEYNGKVYGLPTTINFRAMIANVEIFENAGIEVPKGDFWAWEDFLVACEAIKSSGSFPVSAPVDNMKSDWFFGNGILSNAAEANKLAEVANGDVSCEDPIFVGALTKTKELYDNEFMYPGEGAITLTTDESRAAFYQGKVAMTCEVAAGIGSIINDAPFETIIIPWPAMSSVSCFNGGSDGLFVPANVKDIDAAIEVLKAYTAADVQQINMDQGYPVANVDCVSDDPVVAKIKEISGSVYPYELKSLSPQLSEYINNQALAELVLGGGVEATIEQMEKLREEAIN